MKLRYKFTVMDMGEEFAAVPVEEDADKFHGMLKLNEVSAEIIDQLKDDTTPMQVHLRLKEKYPESTDEEIAEKLVKFLNKLNHEGLLCNISENERKIFIF